MIINNLKKQAVNGVIWSTIEGFGTRAIQFVIAIILARLLTPTDFGLVGMLAIFIAVANSFIDSGFVTALIQKKNTNNTDYSTVFFFNIIIGAVFYGILYLTAPLIADFFKEPKLVLLTRVIALNFVINAFGIIQITILTKKIDFKTQSKIGIISILCSGCVGIGLAFSGFGVWALVFQSLTNVFVRTLLFWIFNSWRPILVFSINSFKSLFSFGSRLLAAGLLDTLFQNIYLIIIGKFFNATSLGFYTQAKKIQELPVLSISSIIQRVTFPVFATIQDEEKRLKNGYRKALKIFVYLLFPIMMGLITIAEPFIRVVLTEKWINSLIYLQLLCIAGMLYPLHIINLSILKVKGRSDLFLRLEIIKKSIIVIAIIIGIQWGVLGLVIGRVITSFISYFINAHYSGKMINYTVKEQLSDILPYFISTLIMSVLTYSISFLFNDNYLLLLITQIPFAIIIYYLTSRLFKLDAYAEIANILKSLLPKKLKFLI